MSMSKNGSALLVGSLMLVLFASGVGAQNEPISDKDINVLHFEELRYPRLALETRIRGLVVIRAKLDKEGRVADAQAISGHPILVSGSLENIKKWRFQPNKQGAVVIIYNFRVLEASCAETNQQFFTLELQNLVTISACPIQLQISSQ